MAAPRTTASTAPPAVKGQAKTGKRGGTTRVPVVSVPAIKFSYHDQELYLVVMDAKVMFQCSVVSRAHEDPEKGYQRHLQPGRMKEIVEYLDDGNVIPGSVVLSAQPQADIKYDETKHSLSFKRGPGSFLVIDGQHRLFGASAAAQPVPLAACIMVSLEQADEVKYFLDINSNQRGVPRTLQLEIIKFLAEDDSKDDVRVRLFDELNTRPQSPLANRLSPHKSVVGKLSHVPFKNAVEPLLDLPPLVSLTFEQKVRVLINFLRAVETILSESTGGANKLVNAAFFQSLFGAFRDIALLTSSRHGNLKETSFLKTVDPLRRIEWSLHKGTNHQAIGEFTKHLISLISSTGKVSDEML